MTVKQTFNSIVDFLTQGFEGKEAMYEEETQEETATYQTEDNLALAPSYQSQANNNLKVVNHPNYKGYEVLICEPRSYDESIGIVKHLKDKKSIILNLHLLDKDQALRIVDFICGATHALNGNQQKIGESVFIFTPMNVALSAESQKSKLIKDAIWNQPQQ